jgi:hypothetical protein
VCPQNPPRYFGAVSSPTRSFSKNGCLSADFAGSDASKTLRKYATFDTWDEAIKVPTPRRATPARAVSPIHPPRFHGTAKSRARPTTRRKKAASYLDVRHITAPITAQITRAIR